MPVPPVRLGVCLAAAVLLTACGPRLGLEVPYRGTPPAVVDAMLRLAEVTKDDTVYASAPATAASRSRPRATSARARSATTSTTT